MNGQPWWDEAQATFFFDPLIGSIVANLKTAYAARGDQAIREQALAFAQDYGTDTVFERHWLPFLAELEAKLHPKPNRAARRAMKRGKAA